MACGLLGVSCCCSATVTGECGLFKAPCSGGVMCCGTFCMHLPRLLLSLRCWSLPQHCCFGQGPDCICASASLQTQKNMYVPSLCVGCLDRSAHLIDVVCYSALSPSGAFGVSCLLGSALTCCCYNTSTGKPQLALVHISTA